MQNTDNTATEEIKKEIEQIVTEAVEKKESTPEIAEQETPEQINWRIVRKNIEEKKAKEAEEKLKLEEARKAAREDQYKKDQQIAELTTMVSKLMSQNSGAPITKEQQQQIIDELEDENIATGAEVKNFVKKFVPDLIKEALSKVEEEKQSKKAQKEKEELPQRLVKAHKDFNEVMQQENFAYLDYHYPEVSYALEKLPDSFDKWSNIYSAIKKLVPRTEHKDIKRLESNAAKPQSMTSLNSPPSSEVGFGKPLTEQEKKDNYRRLTELAAGL